MYILFCSLSDGHELSLSLVPLCCFFFAWLSLMLVVWGHMPLQREESLLQRFDLRIVTGRSSLYKHFRAGGKHILLDYGRLLLLYVLGTGMQLQMNISN
jgi:hypothetical protein